MKLEAFLNQLELFRIKSEENFDQDLLRLELIDLFVEYIDNQKVREKIEEIAF